MKDDYKISQWLRGFLDTIIDTKVTKWKLLALFLCIVLMALIGFNRGLAFPVVAVIHIWFPEPFSEIYHRGNAGSYYAKTPEIIVLGGWMLLLLPYILVISERLQ